MAYTTTNILKDLPSDTRYTITKIACFEPEDHRYSDLIPISYENAIRGTCTEVHITLNNKHLIRLYHDIDGSEDITLNDITGDFNDLINADLIHFELREDDEIETEDGNKTRYSFYEIHTTQGSVTLRWYGEHNSYYSSRVYTEVTDIDTTTKIHFKDPIITIETITTEILENGTIMLNRRPVKSTDTQTQALVFRTKTDLINIIDNKDLLFWTIEGDATQFLEERDITKHHKRDINNRNWTETITITAQHKTLTLTRKD